MAEGQRGRGAEGRRIARHPRYRYRNRYRYRTAAVKAAPEREKGRSTRRRFLLHGNVASRCHPERSPALSRRSPKGEAGRGVVEGSMRWTKAPLSADPSTARQRRFAQDDILYDGSLPFPKGRKGEREKGRTVPETTIVIRAGSPLLLCSSAPLLLCSSAPLLLCSSAPLLLCSSAPLLLCSSAPLLLCSSAPLLLCSSAPLLPCPPSGRRTLVPEKFDQGRSTMAVTLNIFIVSDATGSTAEAVVTSSLVQFSAAHSNIRRFPFVRTEEQVEEVISEAPPTSASSSSLLFRLSFLNT